VENLRIEYSSATTLLFTSASGTIFASSVIGWYVFFPASKYPWEVVMKYVQKIIETHPQGIKEPKKEVLINCIQSLFNCGQTCVTCSDACLGEREPEKFRAVIRATADCADICLTTGKVLSRLNDPDFTTIKSQVNACIDSLKRCGTLCNEHRMHHEHCGVCADLCRECENYCSEYLKMLS